MAIKSFKHKGLEKLFLTGSTAGVQAEHVTRLRDRLYTIDTAVVIQDIDQHGYRLHQLKGDRSEYWSVWISGNYRITFKFEDGNAYVLDYEDYH